mmetsp:Transcript_1361/g.3019  ORF Transcript_1361/g.3019 Transcript_1361/m.3019 type:complete len:94 (+) Transcript_1361:1-282(+)
MKSVQKRSLYHISVPCMHGSMEDHHNNKCCRLLLRAAPIAQTSIIGQQDEEDQQTRRLATIANQCECGQEFPTLSIDIVHHWRDLSGFQCLSW